MRPVAVGDFVTWGSGIRGYEVVKIEPLGVRVDASRYGLEERMFVPWSGDEDGSLKFMCGDRIDILMSIKARTS